MNTSFKEIYSMFFHKITDFNFLRMEEENIDEICKNYLKKAIIKFRKCKEDLRDRDDINEMFNFQVSDEVQEILATLMVVEWATPLVYNIMIMKQFLGDKDFKHYSQANHLEKLILLRDGAIEESDQAIVLYTYDNGNIGDLK